MPIAPTHQFTNASGHASTTRPSYRHRRRDEVEPPDHTPDVPLWQQQCDAARSIRERFGSERALDYVLGQKFIARLQHADRDHDVAAELPGFASEIRSLFTPSEIRAYLDSLPSRRRRGEIGRDYPRAREYEALIHQAKGLIAW